MRWMARLLTAFHGPDLFTFPGDHAIGVPWHGVGCEIPRHFSLLHGEVLRSGYRH